MNLPIDSTGPLSCELIAYGSYQSLGIILGLGTLLAPALIVPASLAARP
jgi:hypothetical protein